jgi:hypothetical protein
VFNASPSSFGKEDDLLTILAVGGVIGNPFAEKDYRQGHIPPACLGKRFRLPLTKGMLQKVDIFWWKLLFISNPALISLRTSDG